MTARVSVTEDILAPAEMVYNLVSNLPGMGEWSPESTGGRWLAGGGPHIGGRFKGSNRNGRHRWSTLVTVTAAEPGRRFAFRITAPFVPIADWEFGIEPTDNGCRIEETWVDLRPQPIRLISTVRTGVADRATFNRLGMQKTLAGLKAAAQAIVGT
ncbi:MAG: SRPBCC family protein [Mycobacteriales bacterium]